MVGMTGFEPAKSLAPKASAIPNFATSRYAIFGVFLTSVGYYVVVATFGGFFGNPKSRKSAVLKGCLRFKKNVLNESGWSPKPPALPTAPHPDRSVILRLVLYYKFEQVSSRFKNDFFGEKACILRRFALKYWQISKKGMLK